VLLAPGALLLRAIGWPASPGIALAGSFALSLAIDAFGLALVFAAGGSILLMGIVIASVSRGPMDNETLLVALRRTGEGWRVETRVRVGPVS